MSVPGVEFEFPFWRNPTTPFLNGANAAQRTATSSRLNRESYTLSTLITHGFQAITGLLWTTHMNPVLSSTLMVLGAHRFLQSSGTEPLVQPIFLNNALQGLTTNVCGDYCVFHVFFLRAIGETLRSCFSLLHKLGDSTHDGDPCVRGMCLSFLELLIMMVCMFLLYLTRYVRLLIHFDLQ